MPKIIVLMGAPGAGKGTQARLLQERLHLPQISTGDIFRALKNAQTPVAHELRDIMERGQLVPDELTIRLVKERTAKDDCRNGYILDGFPRTPAQAASLEKLAAEQGNNIVRWTDFDEGGHFAALETPDLLVKDVVAFFASLRAD